MDLSNYHFFWGGILSQWAKAHFVYKGTQFCCAEQAMMHSKAMLFNDLEAANKILQETNPRAHKRLGRQVKGFNAHVWNDNKFRIVCEINYAKAKHNRVFQEYLLSTNNEILVEASPYDRIWGIGYNAQDAIDNIDNWGQNLLGKALMHTRDKLNSE